MRLARWLPCWLLWLCCGAGFAETGPTAAVVALQAQPPAALLRGAGPKATLPVSLAPASYQSFYVDLPSNVAELRVATREAGGNVDLYVRAGVPHGAASAAGLAAESAFVAAGPSASEQLVATRASTPALTPGRWWISVANPGPTAVTLVLDVNLASSGAAFQIQAGLSGAWYEPRRTYQGFFFQVLDGGSTALATWFTFEPDGAQAYLIGTGPIVGDQVVITELVRTRGTSFGSAFDAAAVVREDWGDLVFTFDGCGSGYASYLPSALASAQGWPAEQLDLERLTSIAGLSCGGTASATSASLLQGAMSGAWYDPARSGEGWMIEVLDAETVFVYWFSYTPDGKQAWFGNIGTLFDGTLMIEQALQPLGGRFGPAYDPAQVSLRPWGAYALTFTGCATAMAAASGPPDYGNFASNRIARLTSLDGTPPCALAAATQAVAGSVLAPANSHVDGDVNDPATPNRDNDGAGQQQPLSNPALVAGYVTDSATGRSGDRFAASSDEFDAYTVQIAAGQVIRLGIADHDPAQPARIDLDLLLYPAGNLGNPLAISEGTGPLEQIRVLQEGRYDIVVRAFNGGSSYVLAIDNGGSASASVPGQLDPFQPLEHDALLLGFADGSGGAAKASTLAAGLGLHYSAGTADRGVRVEVRDFATAAKRLGLPAAKSGGPWTIADPVVRRRHELIALIKAARGHPAVRWAEPNLEVRAQLVPNDPSYAAQWHYPFINLPQAWDLTTGNPGVIAAVIDTGVVAHPDLTANLRFDLGFDFIRNPLSALDSDAIDPNADDVGDQANPNGTSSFHGTHVAGTVAARGNNGSGVSGVGWSTTLMPIRVLGRGNSGTVYDVAQGIRFAAGLANDSGRLPAQRAAVLNLSLGAPGGSCPQLYADAINAARANGVIVVAAAGNDNSSAPGFPAACPGVVSVAATDMVGQRAPYSNFGTTIDIAAPGGDLSADRNADGVSDGVLSTLANDASGNRVATLARYQGTSMATPHVVGVVGLMKAAHPGLTPAQFDSLLTSGLITRDLAGNGASVRDDTYGYGLVDAFKAVVEARRLAGNNASIPPALMVTPNMLDFGATSSSAVVQAANAGQGTLTITSASSNRPWLRVVPQQVNSAGLGSYGITVDRNGLVATSYQGQVTFASSAGSVVVAVGMQVGTPTAAGDLGTLYLVLVDATTGMTGYGSSARPVDGRYSFSIPAVLPGNYVLYAGTDHDRDGNICDPGEACGAYTSLAQPTQVRVGSGGITLPAFSAMPDGSVLEGGR